MRLAFFQPDIPQNLGGGIRLAACLGAGLDVIEPCGFPLTDKAVKRSALDYGGRVEIVRHRSWDAFVAAKGDARVVLFTTKGAVSLVDFAFRADDVLLFGRESAGVPDSVHQAATDRVFVPIRPETRSLNVVTAAAIGLAEALRQTAGFPSGPASP
jgi:tRNA (cytidine/uridine-2'-O-)-methyltransferase